MGSGKRWIYLMFLCLLGVQCGVVWAQQASEDSGGRRSGRSGNNRSTRNSDGDNASGRQSRGQTTRDRENRREGRTQDRESNSRGTRSTRSSSRNGAEAGAETKTVEGAKKASGKSGSSGSSGGARPPINIAFEMQPDPETNIMYIESSGVQPSLNVSALVDKTFVTRVSLYNAKGSEFNQFDVSLRYDPQLIEPVGVDDSSLTGTLVKPASVRVNRQRGILSMSGDFKNTRNDSFMTVAKLQWRALAPAAATPIQFLNTENHPSGVFNRYGENILHAKSMEALEVSPNTGLLNATVAIEPPNGQIDIDSQDGNNPFSAVTLATNISMGTAEGGIQLALVPRTPAVSVGQDFLVDVRYANPKRADLDTVKLEIRFDPTVLEVVDADDGNWITRGINIFDGAYHEQLPFDYHRKNAAYNTTGRIEYEMGFSARTPVPSSGVMATIRFRATAPAAQTVIGFAAGGGDAENSTSSRQTAISFLGFNLIGTPGQRASAMRNAAVTVR